jgi:hypothetical protein
VNQLAEQNNGFLTYKGRPLVRKGNTLYYGFMYEPYVAMLTINSTKQEQDLEMADKVTIQIMSTDPSTNPADIIVKRGEKNGLYQAMDIASIWLERYLRPSK